MKSKRKARKTKNNKDRRPVNAPTTIDEDILQIIADRDSRGNLDFQACGGGYRIIRKSAKY